ncbi:serine/arginine-rich splicing factor RS31 isoform X1 [Helianthus annuus]|uniref:serine/arginine-rich splicing factor RS31 isoform X1 n=2 Tax=Helianthus annuus TaxID=4232 RepID=UPI0016533799|nr:serine/arginine-rich splicing factor RS31 isoform X1 [Helianthus annuus]
MSDYLLLTNGILLPFINSIIHIHLHHCMPSITYLKGSCSILPCLLFLNTCCLNGYAFVYFEDERDAEDAIHALDNSSFGYDRRKLSVEWARGERVRHRDGSKSVANQRPTKTLFIINFDPVHTRVRDIEKHFEPYGNVLHVRIRRNFAFVQFETQEEATKALECTHMSKILDRVVSVEYALRDDSERGSRSISPRRDYGRRRDSPYRSPSPYRRSRPSPDYGRARSPVYDRYSGPSYDRPKSPVYGRYRSRSPVRRSRS